MLITARKWSCGKVMFLHLPVSYSVPGGRGLPDRDSPGQKPTPVWRSPWTETSQRPPRETPPRQRPLPDRDPSQTETPSRQRPPCTVMNGWYASYFIANRMKPGLRLTCTCVRKVSSVTPLDGNGAKRKKSILIQKLDKQTPLSVIAVQFFIISHWWDELNKIYWLLHCHYVLTMFAGMLTAMCILCYSDLWEGRISVS